MTFYVHEEPARVAVRAARDRDVTGELTQRMQVVTTQISERVEHRMLPPLHDGGRGTTGDASLLRPVRNRRSRRATPAPAVAPLPPGGSVRASSPRDRRHCALDRSTTMEGQVAVARSRCCQQRRGERRRPIPRWGPLPPPGTTSREPFHRARCSRMARWRRETGRGRGDTGAAVLQRPRRRMPQDARVTAGAASALSARMYCRALPRFLARRRRAR